MPENALSLACSRFRELMNGKPTGNQHSVPAGRFRAIDQSVPLAKQSASIYADKPYEVVWTEEGEPDETGPAMVSGNLIDLSATVMVRVGYLRGIGRDTSLQSDEYQDVRLIRRVLEEPRNYDSSNTGLVKVDRIKSRRLPIDEEREMVEIQFRLRLVEDQPTQ